MRSFDKLNRVIGIVLAVFMTASITATIDQRPAAAEPHDEVLNILSLTDSYGSGIGVSPKHEASDKANGGTCIKGDTSQVRGAQASLSSKGWRVSVVDTASCMSYKVPQLTEYVRSPEGVDAIGQADVIFIRIGGNDVGFVPKLACSTLSSWLGCLRDGQYGLGDSKTEVEEKITNLLFEIASIAKPGTEILVNNYPMLLGDGRQDWDYTNAGCAALVAYLVATPAEIVLVGSRTNDLNQAIKNAATFTDGHNGVNVSLMDTAHFYNGHGVCGSGDDWINVFAPHPHLFHPNRTAYQAEAAHLELMIGHRFNKRDFDGFNGVEAAWGPYIGDIIKYDNGSIKSWYVAPTGLRHIPTGTDYNCFVASGSTVHYLSKPFVDSLPSAGGDITCKSNPVEPTGDHVYSNLPLACGTEIPYASTYDTYAGFFHGHALDMPAPAGTVVVAPVDGVVVVKSDPNGYGNYIDLTAGDGRVYRFAHMQSTGLAANGSTVEKSQPIGRVGSTGASTGPHLHYEQRVNNEQVTITLNGGTPLNWGARYTSGGDRTTTHKLVSGNCNALSADESSSPRIHIAALGQDGCLHMKEEALNTGWVKQYCGVDQFELEGDRTAILTDSRTLFVKEGALDSPWVRLASNVVDFDLEGDRIGMVSTTGRSSVKQGPLSARWTHVHSNTVDIQLDQKVIIVLQSNGDLLAKVPKIDSRWVHLYSNVESFTLAYQRIVVEQENGSIIAKDGSISAPWVTLWDSPATSFLAVSDRIAVEVNGALWIKDGALDAPWVQLASSGVTHYDMTQFWVATAGNGVIRAKSPNLDSPWRVLMGSHALDVDVVDGYFGFVSGGRNFFAKAPHLNSPWVLMLDGVVAIEFETW